MDNAKGFLTSKTIWGLVITAAASVFGYNVPVGLETEVTTIVTHGFEVFGLILAAYGRVKAEKKIRIV